MPLIKCIIEGCRNDNKKNSKTFNKDVTFHRFPKLDVIKQMWLKKCGISNKINVVNCHICSEHFSPDMFIRDLRSELMGLKSKGILVANAVPNRNLPTQADVTNDTRNGESNTEEKSDTDRIIVWIQEGLDESDGILENEVADLKDKTIKDLREKLDLLLLEYQVLKDKNLEHEVKIKILQKENTTLKKLIFEKTS